MIGKNALGGAMKTNEYLHMNGGVGETSYAKNSSLQEAVILKAKPIVEAAILDLYNTTFPQLIVIADLGCSSGPNALLVISEIIDVVHRKCQYIQRSLPEFHAFLNDLPGNDFNTIFRSLPAFYEKRRKEKGDDEFGSCFIAGVPGSFYGRVFPNKILNFVHSSYSIHWLSQVPLGLESKEGMTLNKRKIYISKACHPCVREAYLHQFQIDFSLFLESRSQEMVDGGRMVLTLLGRISPDPTSRESGYIWEILGEALSDMVSKGLIAEEKLDSFNVPFYAPSSAELEEVIGREGSFIVDRIENFKLNFDGSDENSDFIFRNRCELASRVLRAGTEPMLVRHFGEEIINDLFNRYQEIMIDHLSMEKAMHTNLVISMKKKKGFHTCP